MKNNNEVSLVKRVLVGMVAIILFLALAGLAVYMVYEVKDYRISGGIALVLAGVYGIFRLSSARKSKY